MTPKIIKTEEEHKAALRHVETLMDAEPDSQAESDLELWVLLIDQYEEEQYPIEAPDPIEAIKFRMDQMGLTQKDLVKFIPAKSKVSEVMNRKRGLSLSMIRAFHSGLGIPTDVLVKEFPLSKSKTVSGKVRLPRKTTVKGKVAAKPAPAKKKPARA
jgi:HTH-type transcriptional regulator/antitoxin HigA